MQKKIFPIIHILLIVLLAGAILVFAGLALWQLADLFPQREDRARIQAMNAVLAEHKEEIPTDASGPEAALAVLAENGYTDFSLQQREGELYYLRNTRTLYVKASMEGSWYYTAALDHTYRTSDIDLYRGELNVIVTSLFSGSQYDFYLFGGVETAASLRTRVGEDPDQRGCLCARTHRKDGDVPAQAKARRCDRLRCARRCAPPRRFRPCAKDRPPQVPAAVQGAV